MYEGLRDQSGSRAREAFKSQRFGKIGELRVRFEEIFQDERR